MWKIINETSTGISHIKNNVVCQDKVYVISNGNYSIFALSDGAGSCKKSHIGAEIATRTTCELLLNSFNMLYELDDESIKYNIIDNIILNINNRFDNNNINDYSGTLSFVAIHKNKIIAGNLGDGVVGILENEVEVLFHPKNGEHKNETYFFTSTEYKRAFEIFKGELSNIKGFILMSDGTSESLYERKRKVLASGVKIMFDWFDNYSYGIVQNAIKNNLEHIFKKNTYDDCSIILAKYFEDKNIKNSPITYLQYKKIYYLKTSEYRKLIKQIKIRNQIINSIKEHPLTISQIKNKNKLKLRSLKRILKILEFNGNIIKEQNKYYSK